jgi:DUF2934 family protein
MKTNKNSTTKLLVDSPNSESTPEEIALAAYCLWEQEGRPQGRDVEHWLRAEDVLRQARKHVAVQV